MVIDTDGSAFITKAEFDSLKNNFQTQLDTYNIGIDSKIDNAIATYLAGVKISERSNINFYDGLGKNILITNTANINDVEPGTVGIDMKMVINYFTLGATNTSTGANTVTNVSFSRPSDDDIEVFSITNPTTDSVFRGYSKNTNVSFTGFKQKGMPGTWGRYSVPSTPVLCWHSGWTDYTTVTGDDWNAFLEPTKHMVASDGGDSTTETYCKNLSSEMFWAAGANYNTHTNRNASVADTDTNGKHSKYTSSVVFKHNDVIADYIMDSKLTSSSAVWSNYEPDAYDIVTEIQGQYTTDAIQSWNLPNSSGNGFNLDCWVYMDGKNANAATKNLGWSNNFVFSGVNIISNRWYELTLRQYNKNVGTIKNNINNSILSMFALSGYTGNIEDGFPVTFLVDGGTLKFEIDTTSLERDVYLGFKTAPIIEKGSDFEGLTKDAKISTFKIDGVSVSDGSKLISPNNHKIELSIDGKNIPLFFKLAYPHTDTTTIRKPFTMPTTIEFTKSA